MKRIAPDEYFNNGLAELARFGKHIVLKNNMSSNQHKLRLHNGQRTLLKNCLGNLMIIQIFLMTLPLRAGLL